MFTAKLWQATPSMPWKVEPRTVQRGASRVLPKRKIIVSLKSTLDYFKLVSWLILFVIFAIAIYGLASRVMLYVNQPIAKVSIVGELGYIDQQGLQKNIEPYASTGFLNLDLEGLRNKLEATPWISHVEVERIWPNELRVHLMGKSPVARWGKDGLLNNVGEAVKVNDITAYQSLPLLAGPDYAPAQVMQQYQIVNQLLRPLDQSIASLRLSDRGSWSLTTNTGLELVLGNGDLVEKIRRFSKAYEATLKTKMDNIVRVDLRYNNGLAVAWKDPSKEIVGDNTTKMVARQ